MGHCLSEMDDDYMEAKGWVDKRPKPVQHAAELDRIATKMRGCCQMTLVVYEETIIALEAGAAALREKAGK